jgi:hypothetical protein
MVKRLAALPETPTTAEAGSGAADGGAAAGEVGGADAEELGGAAAEE